MRSFWAVELPAGLQLMALAKYMGDTDGYGGYGKINENHGNTNYIQNTPAKLIEVGWLMMVACLHMQFGCERLLNK